MTIPSLSSGHGAHRARGNLGVECSCVEFAAAEQSLDHADIDAVLQQVSREAMAQRVRADTLLDASGFRRLDDDAMQMPRADRLGHVLIREQPALCVHHALLPSSLPPLAQQGQQISREYGIAIPASLATLDPEQHVLAVDVADLERHNLGYAQASAIGDREGRLMLEAGGCVEWSRD